MQARAKLYEVCTAMRVRHCITRRRLTNSPEQFGLGGLAADNLLENFHSNLCDGIYSILDSRTTIPDNPRRIRGISVAVMPSVKVRTCLRKARIIVLTLPSLSGEALLGASISSLL